MHHESSPCSQPICYVPTASSIMRTRDSTAWRLGAPCTLPAPGPPISERQAHFGVGAGSAIIWSDRHKGHWRLLGFGLPALPGGIRCSAGLSGHGPSVWTSGPGPSNACSLEYFQMEPPSDALAGCRRLWCGGPGVSGPHPHSPSVDYGAVCPGEGGHYHPIAWWNGASATAGRSTYVTEVCPW